MVNTLMETFENTLNQIRDILRKEGITGMDSIMHCVAFVLIKWLNKENCKKLDIDSKYCFDEITKIKEEQEFYETIYNKKINCLIGQINIKMKFKVEFKITSILNLRNILSKIKSIDVNTFTNKYDIVGIIYECHLKTGTSNSMRDLGQYFTNRDVINYMIELCKPKVKKDGEIESILDPTMGTGGFLTMAIKYLNKINKNIDWKINKNKIYGFDIDDNVRSLSLINSFFETNILFEKTFVKQNSLEKDFLIDDKTIIDKVDIILANEPFGIKGLTYAECCKKVKELDIKGTKAEPLFLQLMMQSLNKGGRCAVIVPDGVLFNDTNLHKGTRKYLCENFNLKKVISLEDGLFLNTGVKSSILFFVNNGETEEVEFCKIKMSNGEIVEESIIKVDIKEVEKNDYSLFVNKYNIIEEEKIEGIEYKKLGDILTKKPGKSLSRDKIITGNYPVIAGGESISGYHNDFNYNESLIFVARVGSAGSISYYTDKCYVTDLVGAFSVNKNYIFKYVYYIMKYNELNIKKLNKQTGAPSINLSDMLDTIEIPIPPLSLQKQIVEALDSIYDTIDRNNKVIQNYEKIKKGIIWSNTLNADKKKMGDITEMKIGGTPRRDTEEYWKNGKNLWVSISELNNNVICDTKEKITDEGVNKSNVKLVKKDTILMSFKMSLGKKAIAGKDLYTNEAIVAINGKNVLNKYIYYSIDRFDFSQACSSIATGNLNKEKLEELLIPIPSKQIQEYIVKECEYYDNLIDSLKKENERLQNNNIIDMVLKSVSKDKEIIIDSEPEDDDEKPQPKQKEKVIKIENEEKPVKNSKKTKNITV